MDGDDNPPTANSKPSIKIDHGESRCGPNAAIQKVINLFSSLILKPRTAEPAGSPQLKPPDAAYKKCRIHEYQVEEIRVYRLSKIEEPEEPQKPGRHRLYYFAGGGLRGVPTKEHWLLCAEICSQLPEYEVIIVSYPLAPNSPAHISIIQLQRLYRALVLQSKFDKSRITLAGDSAGGNLASLLGIYGASEHLKENGGGVCPIQSVTAICPAIDHRNQNPQIDIVDPKDPILSRKVIEEVSEGWRGERPLSDPRLSPILADLSCFKQANIQVDGIIALHDVLSPATIEFAKRLQDCGVVGEWLEWERQNALLPPHVSVQFTRISCWKGLDRGYPSEKSTISIRSDPRSAYS